jgi:fructose-specific component phosphotransferase system IIB-like protein
MFVITRTDDNGICYLVQDGLTREQAFVICDSLTASAHKQTYEILHWADDQDRRILYSRKNIQI